jgi:hypothetical protein
VCEREEVTGGVGLHLVRREEVGGREGEQGVTFLFGVE